MQQPLKLVIQQALKLEVEVMEVGDDEVNEIPAELWIGMNYGQDAAVQVCLAEVRRSVKALQEAMDASLARSKQERVAKKSAP